MVPWAGLWSVIVSCLGPTMYSLVNILTLLKIITAGNQVICSTMLPLLEDLDDTIPTTHLSRMEFSTLFRFKGCKQSVETLIRRRVLI